jgi:MoaA/NifB/PqqE/SkfB family radical SAM enzyme
MISFNKSKGKFQKIKENYDTVSECIKRFVRSQKIVTAIKGPQYKRSNEKIEIDITYKCNLRCANCNRSSAQAPSEERMTVAQIEKFVKESVDNGIRYLC